MDLKKTLLPLLTPVQGLKAQGHDMSSADEKVCYGMTCPVFKQNIQCTEQIVDKVVTHYNIVGLWEGPSNEFPILSS
jgi:hypothetical protein